jgi:hypothetical protein
MSQQRFAVLSGLGGTLLLVGLGAALAGFAAVAPDSVTAKALQKGDRDVMSFVNRFSDWASAALPMPPVAVAPGKPDPAQDVAITIVHPLKLAALPESAPLPPVVLQATVTPGKPDPVQDEVEAVAQPFALASAESVDVDLSDPRPPVRLVSLFRPATPTDDPKPGKRAVETPNECLVVEICVDDYLWSFYEVTPKVDTNKITHRVKATIRKKGKTRVITRTIVKYVLADFTWKDPIAAEKAGMPLKDYVIGGMDRRFKLKLYHAFRAMEDAGLMPGITSAFRDNYRQAIASGNKAASDSSFHGGSRRGGYGHGLAIDIVSVKGAAYRADRRQGVCRQARWREGETAGISAQQASSGRRG